jgi:hypothetical protein
MTGDDSATAGAMPNRRSAYNSIDINILLACGGRHVDNDISLINDMSLFQRRVIAIN